MLVIPTRLRYFLFHRLAHEDFSGARGIRGKLLRHGQIFWLAALGLRDDRIQLRASRLSQVTLFSLVPFLALVFSLFQAFGGLDVFRKRVEIFIFENIAVGSQDSFIDYLETFVGRIHGGALGSFSGLLLLGAAVRLVLSIEDAFDELWGVHERRRLFDRVVTYWAVITLGPLLLAASLAGSDALQAWTQARFTTPGWLFSLVPPALTVLSFSVLYFVLPSARVRFRHALTGGVLAGLLFELAKAGYAVIAIHLFRYDAVFGSLGAIPVFIIWVEIAWLIVLLGCKLSFAYQNHATLLQEEMAEAASSRLLEELAARVVLESSRRFRAGEPPPSATELSRNLEVPVRLMNRILVVLCEVEVLREARRDEDRDPGFLPALPPDRLSVGKVVHALRNHGEAALGLFDDRADDFLGDLLQRAESEAGRVLNPVDYRQLVHEVEAGPGKETTTEQDPP
jgi:membrane protein